MDVLNKRPVSDISTLTKQKNTALKLFGTSIIVLGAYVFYLGSNNEVMEADFTVVDE